MIAFAEKVLPLTNECPCFCKHLCFGSLPPRCRRPSEAPAMVRTQRGQVAAKIISKLVELIEDDPSPEKLLQHREAQTLCAQRRVLDILSLEEAVPGVRNGLSQESESSTV